MSHASRTFLRLAVATGIFAGVHSLFAARPVKDAAARIFGRRNRNGLYRVFYLAQSLATGTVLYIYLRQLPDRDLYEVGGPARAAMQLGRIAALGWAIWAALEVGVPGILGVTPLLQWLGPGEKVQAEPEAQGPNGSPVHVNVAGPFTLSQHPLNFAPLPVLWLRPKMTRNLLAFNVLATAYLVIGSKHEALRLRKVYGDAYSSYEASDVPFFFPHPSFEQHDKNQKRVA